MRGFSIVSALICVVLAADSALAQGGADEAAKIGKIYVVGNDVTQDRVILQTIAMYPGQTLRMADVLAAERKLKSLGIFDANPESAPSIEVIDSKADGLGVYKDLLVRVKETQTGRFALGAGFNSKGLVVRIDLEERNLDPFRFPASRADLWERRAFRGAGKTVRLKITLGAPD
jgi:outer membrane protein assembly factor BamA